MEDALELVRTKDTAERLTGLDNLHLLLQASTKPFSASEFTSLVTACLDLLNDDNYRVSHGALQALASAAVFAGDYLKTCFDVLLSAAVERLHDAKKPVRDAARRLLLALVEEMYKQMGPQFREELQRHQLPSDMVKDINARLERIEPKGRSSDGRNDLGPATVHNQANLNLRKSSHKHQTSSHEMSLFGGNGDVTEKHVEPVNLNSVKEVMREFEQISSILVPEEDWSSRIASRQESPNVIGKLMGLDTPSHQQDISDLAHGRRNPQFHLQASFSQMPSGHCHQEDGFFDREINCEVPQWQEEHNCNDTYEMCQLPVNTNHLRYLSLQKGRSSENSSEEKMTLIRQKFMDAKRLSTNGNFHQTNEFQDVVNVLSSNRDLFLKVLQESNSLMSDQLYGRQPIPLLDETKRITVLKPSKMVFHDKFPASGNRNDKQFKKLSGRNRFVLSPVASRMVDETYKQNPTRIVVLKPTPGLIPGVLAANPSILSSPTNLQRSNFFEVPRYDEIMDAREVAKGITQEMRENLYGHQRNETNISSVRSNGYTCDESSFNKSEAEFVGKHSWDYISQKGIPYSSSSPSHASYTLESSVTKEAKKRLSERWTAMVSNSNGTCSEQRHIRRSASTLGEMLAISNIKKPQIFEVDDTMRNQDPRASTSGLIRNAAGESRRTLLRSKSLPANSMTSNLWLGNEALDQETRKMDGSIKQAKKSLFRGKLPSLFFRRSNKGRTDKSQSQDKLVSNYTEASLPSGMPCDNSSEYSRCEEIQSLDLQSANRTLWLEFKDKPRQGLSPEQVLCSTSKPATPRISSEIQDQPSPISVLESTFEEDAIIPIQPGMQPAFPLGISNLIDKSPPIGSIARTLSWDKSSAQPESSNPLKSQFLSGGCHEEGDWLFLIQSLLSTAGVENEAKLCSNPTRWYSLESPLNPLLREKYVKLIEMEPLYGANRTQLRSNCLLVFDCVNGVLVELWGMGSNARNRTELSGDLLMDRIWAQLKHLFLRSDWQAKDGGSSDDNGMVVERVVRTELSGKGWEDVMRVEIDVIGKEVEGQLFEELVEDLVGGWTGKYC